MRAAWIMTIYFLAHMLAMMAIAHAQLAAQSINVRSAQEIAELEALVAQHTPLFFNHLRHDGSGGVTLSMLFASAYAEFRGWVHVGGIAKWVAGRITDEQHMIDVPSMIKFVFGRDLVYDKETVKRL